MDVSFYLDALDEALSASVSPGIFNTDQGAQFTATAFTDAVMAAGTKVSMDGRGCWVDNVFIKRLWRSLKCEAVHLHELTNDIAAWMAFHNDCRPHSALGERMPRMAYEGALAAWKLAA